MAERKTGADDSRALGKFPIWKSLDIGGKSKEQLVGELRKSHILVGPWGVEMMDRAEFVTQPTAQTTNLSIVEVRDLGFTREPWTVNVFARIKELGHSLCAPDAGPHIRLSYVDQLPGEYFWVAMDIGTEETQPDPRVFFVGRSDNGTRWLRGYSAKADFRWVLNSKFVFVTGK